MDFPRFLLDKKVPILLVVGLVTIFLTLFSFRIQLDQNPEEMVFTNDPEYPRLKSFYSWFGYDEIIVAAFSAEDVLEQEALRKIRSITDELYRIPGVERVISLANAQDVASREGEIVIVPLLDRTPKTQADRKTLLQKIEENPFFKNLLVSSNATSTLFDITIDSDINNQERTAILEAINRIFSSHCGKNGYYLTGAPYGRTEFFRCLLRDSTTLFPIAMLLLILAMYIIFRNYLCILLPFMTISLAVVWTVGFMYLLGSEINFLSVLTPTILFIIGTSDCVHILSQYNDCRYTATTKTLAIQETIRLMAPPCFLTTLTTALGLFSLWFCPIEVLQLFGTFTGVGIGFTFILSITLLPLGLAIADTKTLTYQTPPSEALLGLLTRLHGFLRSNKFSVVLASLVLLLLGIYGTTRLQVETDLTKYFGKKSRGWTDTLFIERELGAVLPLYVVIDSRMEDGFHDPLLLKKIDELSEYIRQQEGANKVVAITDFIKYANFRLHDNQAAFYRIPGERKKVAEILLMASLSDTTDLLGRFLDISRSRAVVTVRFDYHDFYRIQHFNQILRSYLREHFGDDPPLHAYTTGTAILLANTLVPILKGLKQSLFLAILTIFLLMIVVFRSWRLGLISMIPNLIPVAMTLGLMGLLDLSLNFTTAPMVAIALGLAIDDTIHFISRFKIEYRKDPDYDRAIYRTLRSVGKPILITSIILVCGFFIFLFSNFHLTQSMGVLISFAVLSAILGDLILLPVLLYLFKPLGR